MPRTMPSALARLLEPRDRVAAGRTASTASVAAATVAVGFEVYNLAHGYGGSTPATAAATGVVAVVLLAGAVAFRRAPESMPLLSWVGLPVFALVAVAALDLATSDATTGAQVAFFYVVVFAGTHLRAPVAWAVTVLTVVADGVVVLTVLPPGEAAGDLVVVGVAVVMINLILVNAGAHQERLTQRLSALAAVDPLTGLATRRELESAAAVVLDRGQARTRRFRDRESGAEPQPQHPTVAGDVGLLIVDVDRFKLLNDTHGHPVGDAVLAHVASVVRRCVPDDATVARLGGDEIAVLLPGTGAERLHALADRLLHAVRVSPWRHGGRTVRVSISVGGARLPLDACPTMSDLYAAADAALYRAKEGGRDRVVVAAGDGVPVS